MSALPGRQTASGGFCERRIDVTDIEPFGCEDGLQLLNIRTLTTDLQGAEEGEVTVDGDSGSSIDGEEIIAGLYCRAVLH